jgi:hypothetical protein
MARANLADMKPLLQGFVESAGTPVINTQQ